MMIYGAAVGPRRTHHVCSGPCCDERAGAGGGGGKERMLACSPTVCVGGQERDRREGACRKGRTPATDGTCPVATLKLRMPHVHACGDCMWGSLQHVGGPRPAIAMAHAADSALQASSQHTRGRTCCCLVQVSPRQPKPHSAELPVHRQAGGGTPPPHPPLRPPSLPPSPPPSAPSSHL